MIKAFLFDYDGVITQGVDDLVIPGRLAHNLNISLEVASNWLVSIWTPFMKAELSEADVWKIFEENFKQPIPQAQRAIWHTWDDLTPLPEMLSLVSKLKAQGYIVGILSNVFEPTKELIRSYGGYNGFDFTILSCEVGRKKPDVEIFQFVRQRLSGIEFSEMVFLDDREPSIITAQNLGIEAIHVTNHASAVRQVHELLKAGQKKN